MADQRKTIQHRVEVVEMVQIHSIERAFFEMPPDDPMPLLKLQRLTFDEASHPLTVQFLSIREGKYRLQYSLSLILSYN